MINFALTLLLAFIIGSLFLKLKVPGGMMIGAIIGSGILGIGFEMAYMPSEARILAQMASGAFIGVGISRENLTNLKTLWKPTLVMLMMMLSLNVFMGFVLYWISDMDLITSLLSAVPGGMTDIPIIAEDMGANATQVALMQFCRMCAGLGIFPSLIKYVGRNEENIDKGEMGLKRAEYSHKGFALTIVIAFLGGIFGYFTGIPAGTLLFSLVAVVIFKLYIPTLTLPKFMVRTAQLLAGAYIGTAIGPDDLAFMPALIIPAIILVTGYFISCFIISAVLHKKFGFNLKEAMLCATPAGASDIVLISADIGVNSPDVVVLHFTRMLAAVSIFTQVCYLVAFAFMK